MRVKNAATNLRRRALQLFEQIRHFAGGQRRLKTFIACFHVRTIERLCDRAAV